MRSLLLAFTMIPLVSFAPFRSSARDARAGGGWSTRHGAALHEHAAHPEPHGRAAPVMIATAEESIAPNLVVNGGFELPALDDGTWNVFREIRGWRTASGAGIEIQRGVAGSPLAGAQLVELDSHDSSAMYQIIDTTPGHRYRVSYWVSPRPGTAVEDNRLRVRWGDDEIDRYAATSVGGDTVWVRREVVVVAHGRETRLEFGDQSASNGLGAYLDEIAVVDVSL